MNRFYAIEPSPVLAPFIKQYWFVSLDNMGEIHQRLLPFGYIGLSIHRTRQNSLLDGEKLPSSYISGQSTRYSKLAFSSRVDFISVVFHPIGAILFFDLPMHEITNNHLPVEDSEDKLIIELENRLTETHDNKKCIELIERCLIERIFRNGKRDYNRLKMVLNYIDAGVSDISLLAQTVCLGYKQFKRIFYEHTGLNPKEYIRIKRFQQASHILQCNPSVTINHLADCCNYYDKSHLIRDFKEFSGYTPGEYQAHCDSYSGYHALFRSAFLDSIP